MVIRKSTIKSLNLRYSSKIRINLFSCLFCGFLETFVVLLSFISLEESYRKRFCGIVGGVASYNTVDAAVAAVSILLRSMTKTSGPRLVVFFSIYYRKIEEIY